MRGQQTAKEEYADQIQKDQDQEKKKYHKTVNIYKKSWIECCWENDTAQSHRRHRHCLVSALYLSLSSLLLQTRLNVQLLVEE